MRIAIGATTAGHVNTPANTGNDNMGRRSKQKGSTFERVICRELSLMITGGKRKDVFWRSAMSGGRATVHGTDVRQSGDICAVAPEGHVLTDEYFIECKHYRDLQIARFVIEGKGILRRFWDVAKREAKRHDKTPVLICKQNNLPVFVVISRRVLKFETWLADVRFDLGVGRRAINRTPRKVGK
jgi:hypothetical protein